MVSIEKIKALIDAYVELAQESGHSYSQIVQSLTDIFDKDELKEMGYGDFFLAASVERHLVKKDQQDYPMELYYGYTETRDGIRHAFELVGMDGQPKTDNICRSLADSLDTSVDDVAFHWDSTQIGVPLAVVEKIKRSAIRERQMDDSGRSWRKQELNTKIAYAYRDASNYKVHNECIIKGEMTDSLKERILACRSEGEWFIPRAVGLPEQRFAEWDEQDDHPWFELYDDSFSSTYERATVDMTCKELVAAFESCKDCWEALEYEAIQRLNPMSVDEIIGDARDRGFVPFEGSGDFEFGK